MKNLFFTLFSFCLATTLLYSQNCANDNNIYEFTHNGKQYEVVKEFKSWSEAANCAVDRGGYLVHINSSSENSAVYDAIVNGANVSSGYTSVFDGGGAAYVWIGATDGDTEGIWLWDGDSDDEGESFWTGEGSAGSSTGKVVDGRYNNWGGSGSIPNEPDDFNNNQDAAGIALSSWPYGSQRQWNDINASNSLYYVIEYDCMGEIQSERDTSICFGEEIELGGKFRTESGTYKDTLKSYLDCDSIVVTDLTVIQVDTSLMLSNNGMTLTANQFGEYKWLNCDSQEIVEGETAISFTPEVPGNYSAIIMSDQCVDTSGCYFVCATQEISVDTSICSGESIEIGGEEISTPGTYIDSLQSFQGCDSLVSYIVTLDEFNLQVDIDDNVLTATEENAEYQWYDCANEQIIEGETGQSFTATKVGEYSVILTQDNCKDTSDCYMVSPLGIDNMYNNKYIEIYPDQTTGTLDINIKDELLRNSYFYIYDINSALIKEGKLTDISNEIRIDVLTRGVYFVKITSSEKSILYKFVNY